MDLNLDWSSDDGSSPSGVYGTVLRVNTETTPFVPTERRNERDRQEEMAE